MKKYLNKKYLKNPAVIIFILVMIIDVIALVQHSVSKNWGDVIGDVALIIMVLNWFLMWNLYDRSSTLAEELMEENMTLAVENYANKTILKTILVELDIHKEENILISDVLNRIKELKRPKPVFTKEEMDAMKNQTNHES